MFDLMIPIMFDPNHGGYATIMWFGDDSEEYLVSLIDGFGISELMEYWLKEGSALVVDKTRKRGILPMELNYDDEGHPGCLIGCGIVLDNGNVHILDVALFKKTCACHPLEWWKCVDAREIKAPGAARWIIPEKEFLSWVNRLDLLMHVRSCMADSRGYSREIMGKNSKILSQLLKGVAGGCEMLSKLPFDWMERARVICRSGSHCRGKRVGLSEYTGADCEFDKPIAFPRDNEEIAWWIKRAFSRDNIVVFLRPNGNAKTGVSLSVVGPSDDMAETLPIILEKTRTGSEAVDHVAFSTRCDLEELKCGGNHVILSRSNFRKLLNGASRVLLGVCKGTAWEEFPLGKLERQSSMSLFSRPESHG